MRRAVLVVLAVLAVLAVWLGWGVWSVYQGVHPTPPNVESLAEAPEVRAADQRAADLTVSQLIALHTRIPWIEPLGTSQEDFCYSLFNSGEDFMGGGTWLPTQCGRTTIEYVAFDGDLQERLTELDSTVAALGWTALQGKPGLAAQDHLLHQPPPGAGPEQTAAAAAQPTRVHADYSRGKTTPAVTFSVGVAQAPGVPFMPGGFDDRFTGPGNPDGRPYLNNDRERSVYFTWQPLHANDLAKTTPHRYTAAFAFQASYYTQPPAPTHTPAPPIPWDQQACRSGSGRCN